MLKIRQAEGRRCEVSKITIEHAGKRYEVKDFMIRELINGLIKVRFSNGICPECGNDTFWIQASPAKPVMRDGGAKQ